MQPLLTIEPADVVLTLKPSHYGPAWTVRLFGRRKDHVAKLRWSTAAGAELWSSDTSERAIQQVGPEITVKGRDVVTPLRGLPSEQGGLVRRIKTFLCVTALLVGVRPFGDAALGQSQSGSAVVTGRNGELRLILARYVTAGLPTDERAIHAVTALAEKDASTLDADGSWSDINYSDATRAQWTAADHLQRLLVMAKASRLLDGSDAVKRDLDAATLRGFRFWLARDFRNPNWWWNEIGVPQLVGEIASLMLAELPNESLKTAITIMERSEWRHVPWTGANLTWGVTIEIVRGCLQNDPAVVTDGYTRMYEEIRYVGQTEEGIQQDDSFHQHGQQLYNGGYGLSFANDVGRFISFSWGTREQIPAEQMEVFSAYILDGDRWMLRGKVIDYSTVGRVISRAGMVVAPDDWTVGPISPAGPAYSLAQTVRLLAALPVPRRAEFATLATALHDGAPNDGLVGNKSFWCSDYMVHRRTGYLSSVKMLSDRMVNGEEVNSEGKKSEHLSDGANFLYMTGAEYQDIFPVWDWTKVPGTTAIQGTLDTGERNPVGVRGKTKFDGGVSDGIYGVATMDLWRGNLRAYKSWFFFDEGYLALGAGIDESSAAPLDVATDINQTRLSGPVLSSFQSKRIQNGKYHFAVEHSGWVYHNHVAYLFPAATGLEVSLLPQEGRWSDIGAGSDAQVTVPVFNLWIDHGTGSKDASYQYLVLPGVSLDEAKEYAKAPKIRTLANTKEVQAAFSDTKKIVEVVFRKPGKLRTPIGVIQVDHACALLLDQLSGGWKVSAADPAHGTFDLTVSVSSREIVLHLPGGAFVGSSVSAFIRRSPHADNGDRSGD